MPKKMILANREFYSRIARMIARRLFQKIVDSLEISPSVALLGPRQVGKTTLAQSIASQADSIYLDLESQSDLVKLKDPEFYLAQHSGKLVILDEIQKMPNLFAILRGLIDSGRREGKRYGRFLLLGSASRDLLRQSGESLAGRIHYQELGPIDCSEVDIDLTTIWSRGGFPESLLAQNESISFTWRLEFIKTYLERDIPALGPRIPAERLRRLWTMLAHRQAGLHNASELAKNLSIDAKTVAHYVDLLVDLMLVRRLAPWYGNIGKRLVKSPKLFIRDSGICHALLQIPDKEALFSHPVCAASFEAFAIEALIMASPQGTQATFYRSSAGAEIDLVLELPNSKCFAIEIKLGLVPQPKKGFFIGCMDIKPTQSFIVYSGSDRYLLRSGIEVIGLKELVFLLATVNARCA